MKNSMKDSMKDSIITYIYNPIFTNKTNTKDDNILEYEDIYNTTQNVLEHADEDLEENKTEYFLDFEHKKSSHGNSSHGNSNTYNTYSTPNTKTNNTNNTNNSHNYSIEHDFIFSLNKLTCIDFISENINYIYNYCVHNISTFFEFDKFDKK
jgi:hypothetical protein